MEILAKLVWVIVGVIIKWLLPGGNIWDTKWAREIRARRHQKALQQLLAQSHEQLSLGGFTIRDIAAVQVFEPALSCYDVLIDFMPNPTKLAHDLQELEYDYLPQRVDLLKGQGKTVDMNDRYALR